MRDPKLVWEWYEWRRRLVGEAEPNPGHRALVDLEKHAADFTLVTQNVDGLHGRAGSRTVIELHGNILRTVCSAEKIEVNPNQSEDHPPVCSSCGAPLRPDVVWFGEALPAGAMESASRAARKSDIFFSIGTSSLVYPAAALPYEAGDAGITVVEVNPEDTPLTSVADYALRGTAGDVLPALVEAAFR